MKRRLPTLCALYVIELVEAPWGGGGGSCDWSGLQCPCFCRRWGISGRINDPRIELVLRMRDLRGVSNVYADSVNGGIRDYFVILDRPEDEAFLVGGVRAFFKGATVVFKLFEGGRGTLAITARRKQVSIVRQTTNLRMTQLMKPSLIDYIFVTIISAKNLNYILGNVYIKYQRDYDEVDSPKDCDWKDYNSKIKNAFLPVLFKFK